MEIKQPLDLTKTQVYDRKVILARDSKINNSSKECLEKAKSGSLFYNSQLPVLIAAQGLTEKLRGESFP